MAGTRLVLTILFCVQTSCLIYLAVVMPSWTSCDISTWYNYELHQTLFSNRNGIDKLQHFDVTLETLKSLASSIHFRLKVHLIFSEDFSEDNRTAFRDTLQNSVKLASNISTEFVVGDYIAYSARNWMEERQSNHYRIHISFVDTLNESIHIGKFHATEDGTMILQLQSGQTDVDYTSMLRYNVANQLKEMFDTLDLTKDYIPIPHIIFTVIDSDPTSRIATNLSMGDIPIDDHQSKLVNIFNQILMERLVPILDEKLNKVGHTSFSTQMYNWFGFDVTSVASENYDSHGKVFYDLQLDKLRPLLSNGDLSSLLNGVVSSPEDFHLYRTLRCIMYIPGASFTPLLISKDNNRSQVFSITTKRSVVSVANIMTSSSATATDEEDSYYREITQSITHFIAYIRTQMGLPTALHSKTIGNLYVYYDDAHEISSWEIERIIRSSLSRDAMEVISYLERIYNTVTSRPGLSIPPESSQRIVSCSNLLYQILLVIKAGGNDLLALKKMMNEAVELSSQIISDKDIFELPHVPVDQIFAIFGSLLLPLCVPLIKNLIVEMKRFLSHKLKKSS